MNEEPESLAGLLERGRGAGGCAALADRARASDIVVACVLHDPRWDRQVESRETYYARLLLELAAPLEAIVEAAAAAGDPLPKLARAVAQELARRGVPVRIEPDLEAEVPAQPRSPVIGSRPIPPIDTAETTAALLASATPNKLRKLVDVIADRRGASDRDAVRSAATSGSDDARDVALWVLGRWSDVAALYALDSTVDDVAGGRAGPRLVGACAAYLTGVGGDEALARARAWCALGYPWQFVADRVLEAHARSDDLELLAAEVARALASDEQRRLHSLAIALGRVGRPEGVPALERAWRETRYSFARGAIIDSIAQIAGGAHPFVVEGLWDCESHVVIRACGHARGSTADARRRELATDPWELPEIRSAAT